MNGERINLLKSVVILKKLKLDECYVMDEQLKNLKFSTKSIMITDKQKEFIETLLDELIDYGDDSFNDIEYWKLSKQDAAKLIQEMKDELDGYLFTDEYDDYTDSMDYGDN